MLKTVFAFSVNSDLISLYWILHIFFYYKNLKPELIGFENNELVVSVEEGIEVQEALKKIERETETFRIVKSRS